MMNKIICKRIYDAEDENDGFRVLADRLWPRGIKKEKAGIDFWAKEFAPSNELRKWFSHIPDKFNGFSERYREELELNPGKSDFIDLIKTRLKDGNVTILYGSRDTVYNNAVVLKKWLEEKTEAR